MPTATKVDNVVDLSKKKQAAGRMGSAAESSLAKKPQMTNPTLPLDVIDLGENPRTMLDSDADLEMVASIKQHGVLQPIRVRPGASDRWTLIAGSRRLAAAKVAGLKEIPVVIATPTDDQAFVQALVENLQRQDLNPIDEAKALRRLLTEGKMTQKQLGTVIGRSQPYIANAIGLLELAPAVQERVENRQLSVAAAKALRSLPAADQEAVANRAVAGEITSKDVEAQAAERKRQENQAKAQAAELKEQTRRVESAIADAVESKAIAKRPTIAVAAHGVDLEKLKLPDDVTIVARDWQTQHSRNGDSSVGFSCACKAFALQFQYGSTDPVWTKVCVKPEHWDKFQAELKDENRKVANAAAAKLRKLKKDLAPNLSASPTELSTEGSRLMLYAALNARPQQAAAFCRRVGVAHPKLDQYAQAPDAVATWTAIEKADMELVVDEFVQILVDAFVPDVFKGYAYDLNRHAHVREWLQQRFGLDAEFVWGGREKEFGVGEFAPKPTVVTEAAMQEEAKADENADAGDQAKAPADADAKTDPEATPDAAEPDTADAGSGETTPDQDGAGS